MYSTGSPNIPLLPKLQYRTAILNRNSAPFTVTELQNAENMALSASASTLQSGNVTTITAIHNTNSLQSNYQATHCCAVIVSDNTDLAISSCEIFDYEIVPGQNLTTVHRYEVGRVV